MCLIGRPGITTDGSPGVLVTRARQEWPSRDDSCLTACLTTPPRGENADDLGPDPPRGPPIAHYRCYTSLACQRRGSSGTLIAVRRRSALVMRTDVVQAGSVLRRARQPQATLASMVDDALAPERKWWCDSAVADVLHTALLEADELLSSHELEALAPAVRSRRAGSPHVACHKSVQRVRSRTCHAPSYPFVGQPVGGGRRRGSSVV